VKISWLALSLLAAGCDAAFDDEPLDGGQALHPATEYAEIEEHHANDPCMRWESRGWHSSVQHCRDMLPPQRMTGIWVRAFEISDFHPGAASFSEVDEGRRDTFDLEVFEPAVARRIGRPISGDLLAVAMTFIGRRTRVPWIDCQRGRHFTIVVDRIERAEIVDTSGAPPPTWDPPQIFPPSPQGTVLRRLEDENLARCNARRTSEP
jgi:hypothetical protein